MTEKQIKKVLRPQFKLLLVALILAIIAVAACFGIDNMDNDMDFPRAKEFNSVRINNKEKDEKYVKTKVVNYIKFADDEDGNVYCFANDNYDNKFIIIVYSAVFERWEKETSDNAEYVDEVYGKLYKTSNNLKNIAIDSYNEIYCGGRKMLKEDNYQERLGKYTFDATDYESGILTHLMFGIAIIGFTLAMACVVFFIVNIIKFKKRCAAINMDIVRYELAKPTTKAYPKVGVYLTDNYVITMSGIFVSMIEYKTLAQVYISEYREIVIPILFNIIGKGTNKKEYNIAVSYRRKYLDEIVAEIKKHNTKIVAGYFNGKIDEYQDIARKAKMY